MWKYVIFWTVLFASPVTKTSKVADDLGRYTTIIRSENHKREFSDKQQAIGFIERLDTSFYSTGDMLTNVRMDSLKDHPWIIVQDKNDRRLIKYLDSLSRYNAEMRIRRDQIKQFDAAPNLGSYNEVSRKLGYSNTDNELTEDRKEMYGDNVDSHKIIYSLLTSFHSRGGDICGIYRRKVKKPMVEVIYQEPDTTRLKHIIYVTEDQNGQRTVTGHKIEIVPKLSSEKDSIKR